MAIRKNYLKGRRFGKLLVIEDLDEKNKFGEFYSKCKCDCGNEIKVLSVNLLKNHTTSCGCIRSEKIYPNNSQIAIKNLEKIAINNTSGIKGVSYNKQNKKWIGHLMFQGTRYFKNFDDINDAIKYRKELEEKYFIPQIEEWKEKGIIK